MTLHQRTHPVYVDDCDPCRWSSVKLAGWTTSPDQRCHYFKRWMDEQEIGRTKRLASQGIVPRGTTTPALDEAEHMSRMMDAPYNAADPVPVGADPVVVG